MKTLKQLIESKSKKLATVSPKDTVLHALEVMAQYDVGALIVLDGQRLAGMFSERDYARKVILQGKVSVYTKVGDIMTDKVISVTMNHTIEQCLAIMSEKHFRHLPVLDDEGLVVGIISIGDMVKEMISQQQFIINQLESYISS
ncbi:CBS domain containing membrane protein [Candidatus Propionivibrio aalborgensis]|jgi:CBS domain-containing protein|uniref:CBS domain containing membrane protein n=1 Tax=Candidatus Propionivibrio aalborgensis TaxID=1860101 RepID=A0A1A8XII1_9RHOO|nr:CBS domain-containing protein [Candidatus Propionivibrio aalborgensis]MBK7325578.1 CBS domain-containing protein [Propionivibrio sp.]MBK7563477.1 CBS domain-containing protein [Propionivibrio sp.]MBK9027977.1 CBS domain-containing protein [Propionivibrio sp.]MBP6421548.1 CBS domain-containing protein [Propionivibrio sp.]SBT04994.1 CBS domain containing membrane protein [Candidatus Propionivibrio aalborgensis]